jgi:hypothetical protein
MANFFHHAGDVLHEALHSLGDEFDKVLAELRRAEQPAVHDAEAAVGEAVKAAETVAESATSGVVNK